MNVNQADLYKLLDKLRLATDHQCLYALEEDFNRVGLTVQTTAKNRIILCRLNEGRPVAKSVIEDYIFVGSLDMVAEELSDRMVEKICSFIKVNAGPPDVVKNVAPVWRDGLRMYEATVAIFNEDVIRVSGELMCD